MALLKPTSEDEDQASDEDDEDDDASAEGIDYETTEGGVFTSRKGR